MARTRNNAAEVAEPTAPEVPEETTDTTQEDAPDTNGAGDGREPQVTEEPAQSFDERTGAGTPPWQREDGSQDNGS